MSDKHYCPQALITPDGVDGEFARINVLLTPSNCEQKQAGPGIPLKEWPLRSREQMRQVRIAVAGLSDKGAVEHERYLDIGPLKADSVDLDDEQKSMVSALWKDTFPDFAAFGEALESDAESPPVEDDFEKATAGWSGRLITPMTADIEINMDAFYAFMLGASIAQRLKHSGQSDKKHFGKYSDYSLIDPMGWREFSKFVNALSKKTYSEYSTSRNLVGLIQDRSDVIRFYESIGANVVEQFGSQEKLAALDDNAIGAFRQLVRKASASVSANGATTPNRLEAEAFCAIAENYCAAMGMGWRGKLRDVTDSVGRAKFESTLRAYDKEDARHKFSLILSFPLLAKVFGFCFDIKVPISFLEERSNGLIAVDLHQDDIKPSANRLTWTAYEGSAAQSLFRPWAGHFGDEASKEVFGEQYSGGLVNFGQQIRKARRFRLGQAGPANDFRAAIATAEFVAKQFDEGRIPASGVEPLIERRRRGIVIYDMFAGIAKKLELLREGEQEGAAVAQPTINYERDLVRGVRLDVQVGETSHSWSPLMARHVAFTLHDTERDAAFQRLIKKPEYRNYADREEGYCTQLISTDRSTEDEQEASEIWVAPDELAVWSGDSMALSGSQGEEGVEQEIKVPFQVQLSLPEEVSRQPAPLRDRSCYSFRGRLAYANGCGQPFEAELSGWNAEAHLLTGDDGRPYRYARSETVEPPDVLLPEDCALVRARDVDDLDAQAPGESVDCIVVRSSGTARRKKATRILLPPRATWEQAERQRQFDDSDDAEAEKALLGAFRERLAIAACGGLPEARGGAVVLRNMEKLAGNDVEREFEFKNDYKVLSGPKHPGKKFDSQQSRGPVFAGGNGIKHRGAFFADADGHTLRWRIAAARDGVNVAASEAATMSAQPEARFWEDGVQKPYEAKPIRLDVVADDEDDTIETDIDKRLNGLTKLTFRLPKATVWDLEIYCAPVTKRNWPTGAAHIFGEAQANDIWLNAVNDAPLRQIANKRTLRLVHAVARPLSRPEILEFNAVPITPKDTRTWADFVEGCDSPPHCWQGEEGGSATFFVGKLGHHPASTGAIRCEARWREYGSTPVVRRQESGTWRETCRQEYAQLFKIDTLPADGASELDLLRREDSSFRGLSFAFPDGRARKLRVKVVATSRFRTFYPREQAVSSPEPPEEDRVGEFDEASSSFDDAPEFWAPCTFRPPEPGIDRVMPIFKWSLPDRNPEKDIYEFSRETWLRIHIKPDWYASGEGEQLALLFMDVNQVCDFDTEKLRPFARYLTRIGSDPIRVTGPVPINLNPDWIDAPEISGAPVGNVRLFAETSGKTDKVALDVTLLPLTPKLDSSLGQYYCDIRVRPPQGRHVTGPESPMLTSSYEPFLQLGLARYQPNGLNIVKRVRPPAQGDCEPESEIDLRLSAPVDYTVRLLPDRKGSIRIDWVNGRLYIYVALRGPGHWDDAEGEPGDPQPKSKIRARLYRLEEVSGARSWRPHIDGRRRKDVQKEAGGRIDRDTGEVLYEVTLETRVAGLQPEKDFAVSVEEYDLTRTSVDQPDDNWGPIFSTFIQL